MRELLRSKLATSVDSRGIRVRESGRCDVIAITRTTLRIHEIPVFVPLKDIRSGMTCTNERARTRGERTGLSRKSTPLRMPLDCVRSARIQSSRLILGQRWNTVRFRSRRFFKIKKLQVCAKRYKNNGKEKTKCGDRRNVDREFVRCKWLLWNSTCESYWEAYLLVLVFNIQNIFNRRNINVHFPYKLWKIKTRNFRMLLNENSYMCVFTYVY